MMIQNRFNTFAYLRYFYPIFIRVRCFSVWAERCQVLETQIVGVSTASLSRRQQAAKQKISLRKTQCYLRLKIITEEEIIMRIGLIFWRLSAWDSGRGKFSPVFERVS